MIALPPLSLAAAGTCRNQSERISGARVAVADWFNSLGTSGQPPYKPEAPARLNPSLAGASGLCAEGFVRLA